MPHGEAESTAMSQLCEIDPHLNDQWVCERNIHTFGHFPIVEADTVAEQVNAFLDTYSDRPCWSANTSAGPGRYRTFGEARAHVFRLAHALSHKVGLKSGDFVAICMENRIEWVYTDLACALNQFVSVGVITNWPVEDIRYVFNDASVKCVVCSDKTVGVVTEAARGCSQLKHIVVAGSVPTTVPADIAVYAFADLQQCEDASGKYRTLSGLQITSKSDEKVSTPARDRDVRNTTRQRIY